MPCTLLLAVCIKIDSALRLCEESSEVRICKSGEVYLDLDVLAGLYSKVVELNVGREISYPMFECREVGDDRG